jgi:hypothetical protein
VDEAKAAKEQIIEEARGLADSTEWGPDLGRVPRPDDPLEGRRVRPARRRRQAVDRVPRLQDQFFNARTAAQSAQDEEFRGNLEAKEALLDEAEADDRPVTDVEPPPAPLPHLPGEVQRARQGAPRRHAGSTTACARSSRPSSKAEDDEWKRTDPEARQRAEETVAMLSTEIDKLQAKADQGRGPGRQEGGSRRRGLDRHLHGVARPGEGDAGRLHPLSQRPRRVAAASPARPTPSPGLSPA